MGYHPRYVRDSASRSAFSLIELLCVAGVLAMLASLTLASLAVGKSRADAIRCQNQLRSIGLSLQMYASDQNALPHRQFLPGADFTPIVFGLPEYYPSTQVPLSCPIASRRFVPVGAFDPFRSPYSTSLWPSWAAGYGYNAHGTDFLPASFFDGRNLGLEPQLTAELCLVTPAVRPGHILNPSRMITFGDSVILRAPWIAFPDTEISPYGEVAARHRAGANMLMFDGHVAWNKAAGWSERTIEARRQWNADNEPHSELPDPPYLATDRE